MRESAFASPVMSLVPPAQVHVQDIDEKPDV